MGKVIQGLWSITGWQNVASLRRQRLSIDDKDGKSHIGAIVNTIVVEYGSFEEALVYKD